MTTPTTASSVSPAPAGPRPRAAGLVVWGVVVLAALGGALADGQPTGIEPVDAVWRAAFAGLFAAAAARLRPFGQPPAVGAVIGGLAAALALRLPAVGFHGLPSLLAGLALLMVCALAYRASTALQRRHLRAAAGIGAALVGLMVLGVVVAVLTARADVERGVDDSRQALQLLREGEADGAGDLFRSAAAAFDGAAGRLDAPWARPGRLLPLVGLQLDAMEGASVTGEELATSAATTAETGRYQDLRLAGGQIDLPLVRAMQAPVEESVGALRTAHVELQELRSPWLVAPLADRLDGFTDEVAAAIPGAELALEGLTLSPGMLGGDGPRRYLVVVTTPATGQPLGGQVGSYAVLLADGGRVSLETAGTMDELAPAGEGVTITPDLPAHAERLRELYTGATGDDVHGVVATDPYGLAAFVLLTGDVRVEGMDIPLTPATASAVLDRAASAPGGAQLTSAAAAIFTALTRRELPGPITVGDALGPAVDEGRLRLWTFAPDEQRFLDRLGVSGR